MPARNPWGVYAALLFGTFVTIEAAAFQAPALPSVTAHFGIPVSLAALILILYFLGLTVFAPIMGRFGDQHGRRKVLVAGMLIFAIAEFAAAWAPSFEVFLAARFAQGFGVACILPGVFAYVTHLFPERRRGTALGILAFTMTFGAASGGAARRPAHRSPGLASLTLLWKHSHKTPAPVIDVAILSRPGFALPSAIYWLHMLFFSGVVYSLAFFINNRPGGTAAQFGFVTLFLYGSGLLSSPLAGRLTDRFEPSTISILALLGSLFGVVLFIGIDTDTPLWAVILIVCIFGLTMGANTPAVMKMAFSAVPPQKMGAGTGLFSMFRDLGSPTGSSFSLAVFGATLVYQARASLYRQGETAGLDAIMLEALASTAGTRLKELPAEVTGHLAAQGIEAESLLRQAGAESLDAALTNVGYLLAAIITLALILGLLLSKQRSASTSTVTQS